MALYEVLYGIRCKSPIGWFKVSKAKLLGLDLVQDVDENVKIIREKLAIAQSRQMSYADKRK